MTSIKEAYTEGRGVQEGWRGADTDASLTLAPYVWIWVIPIGLPLVGGLIVGALFKWWGLVASLGFAVFLAYQWEFSSEGNTYAAIVGLIASGGVFAGTWLRRLVACWA